MSKLVRARVKAVEYLPEIDRCCAKKVQYISSLGPLTVDLSLTKKHRNLVCKCCRVDIPDRQHVWGRTDQGREGWIPFDAIDLDEVPPELQSDKYVDSMSQTTAERIGG